MITDQLNFLLKNKSEINISEQEMIGKICENLKDREFEQLKKILYSDIWPKAVDTLRVSRSESDKLDRANGILNYVGDLSNLRVLDFGCGEGHFLKVIKNQCKFCIGYDIAKNNKNKLITTSFEEIKNLEFDVIVLNDVLDWAEKPIEILNKIRHLCKAQTKVFLRLHPWSSRHGAELYHILNKAYIHIIFSDEELKKLGLNVGFNNKVKYPLITYDKWINEAGFKIIDSYVEGYPHGKIFEEDELIKNRIYEYYLLKKYDKFPVQIGIDFIEYQVEIKEKHE